MIASVRWRITVSARRWSQWLARTNTQIASAVAAATGIATWKRRRQASSPRADPSISTSGVNTSTARASPIQPTAIDVASPWRATRPPQKRAPVQASAPMAEGAGAARAAKVTASRAVRSGSVMNRRTASVATTGSRVAPTPTARATHPARGKGSVRDSMHA